MHFVTRKKLDRRTFLRGAGAGIALPLVDAMLPAFATSGAELPTRLVCIEEVHGLPGCSKWGIEQNLFAPATTGRDFTLLPDNTLKVLEPWIDQMTIVRHMTLHVRVWPICAPKHPVRKAFDYPASKWHHVFISTWPH